MQRIKKIKILFVLGYPNPFAGAAWTRIGYFADNWSKKGYEVNILGAFTVATLRRAGASKIGRAIIYNNIFHLDICNPVVFVLNSLISFVTSVFSLLAQKPSLVLVSVPKGDVGLGAIVACKLTGTKYIVDYRDEWENYEMSLSTSKAGKLFYSGVKRIAAILYVKSQMIGAVTSNFVDALRLRGVVQVVLLPNGADTMTFKPSSPKTTSGEFRLFYSGIIGCYYKLDIVIKSVSELVKNGTNDLKLIFAGDGESQTMLSLAEDLGVSNNVEYLGVISDKNELARLISNSDVGIIPYDDNPLWKNSVPAKFFEYCACGIPIIATAYEDSLIANLITQNGLGLTSPPLDVKRLAESIYQIYADPKLQMNAGKKARTLIEEKFNRNKTAETYLDLLKAKL